LNHCNILSMRSQYNIKSILLKYSNSIATIYFQWGRQCSIENILLQLLQQFCSNILLILYCLPIENILQQYWGNGGSCIVPKVNEINPWSSKSTLKLRYLVTFISKGIFKASGPEEEYLHNARFLPLHPLHYKLAH